MDIPTDFDGRTLTQRHRLVLQRLLAYMAARRIGGTNQQVPGFFCFTSRAKSQSPTVNPTFVILSGGGCR
jgi:hypothetical protein